MRESSTPSFNEFDPDIIPYQREVIRLINRDFDYSLGTLEILLSGSVGSAKSILAAHVGILHCLQNKKARLLLGRKALPDLKDTIFQKILEHLEGTMIEKKHFWVNHQRASIKFINGSEIISRSWSDRKYKKMRSIELSAAIIEELTENDSKDKMAYDEIKMRVGRLPHVKQNFIIAPTNPDSPSHWAYDYWMVSKAKTRRVFYSVTTDNPFLPAHYISQLKEDLDPRMAQRMIYGKWIEMDKEVVYYEYDTDKNHRSTDYQVDGSQPIFITFDFNIGIGKPLSVALMQYVDDCFHIYGEVVVHGMRTLDAMDELADRGILAHKAGFVICGDATGRHRDTRNRHSDWDIIKRFLANVTPAVRFEMLVPHSNPKVRERHIKVNSYCHNAGGKRRLFTYKGAPVAAKGMRLTKLREGSAYQEDDRDEFQHITTAIGYAVCAVSAKLKRKRQGTLQL